MRREKEDRAVEGKQEMKAVKELSAIKIMRRKTEEREGRKEDRAVGGK